MLKVLIEDFITGRKSMHSCQSQVEKSQSLNISVLSTYKFQGLYYQKSRGQRSQLMLMHENGSRWSNKSVEAKCTSQTGAWPTQGDRKAFEAGVGLPGK